MYTIKAQEGLLIEFESREKLIEFQTKADRLNIKLLKTTKGLIVVVDAKHSKQAYEIIQS